MISDFKLFGDIHVVMHIDYTDYNSTFVGQSLFILLNILVVWHVVINHAFFLCYCYKHVFDHGSICFTHCST